MAPMCRSSRSPDAPSPSPSIRPFAFGLSNFAATNLSQQISHCTVTLFGQRRFIGMRRSYYYHAQADHARRLADITVQPNVEEILRHVAEELDRLADDVAAGEPDFGDPEMLQGRKP
jgi:hypothetical protein